MDSFEDIWALTLETLKTQTTEVAYNVWFAPLKYVQYENDTVYLSTDSNFKIDFLNKKFHPMIRETLCNILGFEIEVKFVLTGTFLEKKEAEENEAEETQSKYEYTFDNFITGSSNRFAHAAALNVAKHPGVNHNPLFIYGPSGLGKTHLLLAIYNQLGKNFPDKNIIYTSGEHFMNELIYYINKQNTRDFHDKYRQCDVLLVDDIHFISRGDTTQEEFFHTFNALKNSGKQIVFSSDRPPKDMRTLEDRLRTRFESGLIVDIKPPVFETRVAIIKRKCRDLDFDISDNVAQYIAGKIEKNIRQIEGVVNKLKAFHDIEGTEPSLTAAKKAISDLVSENNNDITISKILDEVSRAMSVSVEDICSEKRNSNIVLARRIAIYVASNTTGKNRSQIGDEIGKMHHSSIIYHLNEIEKKFKQDDRLKALVDDIIKNVKEE